MLRKYLQVSKRSQFNNTKYFSGQACLLLIVITVTFKILMLANQISIKTHRLCPCFFLIHVFAILQEAQNLKLINMPKL